MIVAMPRRANPDGSGAAIVSGVIVAESPVDKNL
jgi:hypothetical protein